MVPAQKRQQHILLDELHRWYRHSLTNYISDILLDELHRWYRHSLTNFMQSRTVFFSRESDSFLLLEKRAVAAYGLLLEQPFRAYLILD